MVDARGSDVERNRGATGFENDFRPIWNRPRAGHIGSTGVVLYLTVQKFLWRTKNAKRHK